MRYNTGNPVGADGSSSPFDLHDNSGNIDVWANDRSRLTWPDRLGVERKTFFGMEQQVTDFLIAMGYESVYLVYGAGVVVERQTQLVQRDGELYRVMNASDIPLTLTGTWATDAPKLQAVGDAALRQALALSSGSGMVGFDSSVTYPAGTVGAKLKTAPVLNLSAASDPAQALTDFAASLNGRTGRVEPGTYILSKQVELPANVDLDLNGVTLDFSSANVSNFPNGVCLRSAPGTLTLLPALSATASIGSDSIVFAAAHGLKSGDAIILHNETSGSYSGFRPEYQQGQFAVVRSVSGLTVYLTAPLLYSVAAAANKIYLMAPSAPNISGGVVLMPTTGVMIAAFSCDVSRNPTIDKMKVYGTSGAGILFSRTLGGVFTRGGTYSDRESAANDNYGLSLSNCQDCYVKASSFAARRHAVTMGGSSGPGSVPTRFCVVESCELTSWDIQCADMHGNVEHCQYVNCVMQNGVTISGNHNAVRNSTIIAPAKASTGNGVAISINEMKGTSFAFENLKILGYGDPSTTGRGLIDCGGNSTSMGADTTLGGVMSFRNIDISAANCKIPIKIINRGSTAANREVDIRNVRCHDSPATRSVNAWVEHASGNIFDRVSVDITFPNAGAPASTTVQATRICGMREAGTVAITTAAATTVDTPVTFNRRFPKAPSVRVSGNLSAAGSNCWFTAVNVTVSGFTLRMFSTSAMTQGVAAVGSWEASLEE